LFDGAERLGGGGCTLPSPDCRKNRKRKRVGGETKGTDMQVKEIQDRDQKKRRIDMHTHRHVHNQ
jgi:hypothetical protein